MTMLFDRNRPRGSLEFVQIAGSVRDDRICAGTVQQTLPADESGHATIASQRSGQAGGRIVTLNACSGVTPCTT